MWGVGGGVGGRSPLCYGVQVPLGLLRAAGVWVLPKGNSLLSPSHRPIGDPDPCPPHSPCIRLLLVSLEHGKLLSLTSGVWQELRVSPCGREGIHGCSQQR